MAFKNLINLSASNCNISNVTALINQLGPTIIHLDLSGNNFNQLPAAVFENLTNLHFLNLSHANLWTIKCTFDKNPGLDTLDLSYNDLKNVDLSTVNPRWLLRLYLEGNELTQIQNLFRFEYLWEISISKNRISCTTLTQGKSIWRYAKFKGNTLNQKYGDCSSAVRLLGKLGFVGTLLLKWF